MRMIAADKICHWLMPPLIAATVVLSVIPALAGPYLDSAHGNNSYGVDRSSLDLRYADYATGTTLMRFAMAERLARVARDLENPALAGQPVSSIAFEWGFNDAAHFSPASVVVA